MDSRLNRLDHNNFKQYESVSSILVYGKRLDTAPFISFVIPTCNRSETLIEAVKSITDCKPSFTYEIVIVDNSGTTEDIDLKLYPIEKLNCDKLCYYTNEKNIGMAGNFNRCFELAMSNWVAMLHDDDLISKDYGKEIVKCIDEAAGGKKIVGLIKTRNRKFSSIDNLPETGNHSGKVLIQNYKFESLILGKGPGYAPSCGIVFNKKAVFDVGGYCEDAYPSLDHLLGFRMQKMGYSTYVTGMELGFYRYGINESAKISTLKAFILKDQMIRKYMYETNILYKTFGFIFEKAQYCLSVEEQLNYSRELGLNIENIQQLDTQKKYCGCFIRKTIIRGLRKCIRMRRKEVK